MKVKLKMLAIQNIEFNCNVLRSCLQVPFPVANQINGVGITMRKLAKGYEDQISMIEERMEEAKKVTDATREAAIEKVKKDNITLNKKEYEVEFTPIKISEFSGAEIGGEKAVPNGMGGVNNICYRDAYFDLIADGVIVE